MRGTGKCPWFGKSYPFFLSGSPASRGCCCCCCCCCRCCLRLFGGMRLLSVGRQHHRQQQQALAQEPALLSWKTRWWTGGAGCIPSQKRRVVQSTFAVVQSTHRRVSQPQEKSHLIITPGIACLAALGRALRTVLDEHERNDASEKDIGVIRQDCMLNFVR